MASFDFIEATSKGYEFSWYERSYLMRAAIPVILVKIACILVVRFIGAEEQYLLNGLLFMPAHVLEALLMISVIRYIAFSEPLFEFGRVMGAVDDSDLVLEKKPEVKETKGICASARVQMFKAGVAMYLLIKIIQLGLLGVFADFSKTLEPVISTQAPEHNAVSVVILIVITSTMLWAFRLVWLYIPVALGHSVSGFMARIKGMMSSLSIFATWFVCYFPVGMLLYGIFSISNFVLTPESALHILTHDIIKAFGETLIVLVQVAAMTFGFIEVLTQQEKKK